MSGVTTGRGPERTTHHVYHDWRREGSVADTIVDAVAGFEGVDSRDLMPLGRSINPDALEAIFDGVQIPDSEIGRASW